MKKSLALLVSALLVLTLVLPGVVLASGKGGGGIGEGDTISFYVWSGTDQPVKTIYKGKASSEESIEFTITGGPATDRLVFNGANIAENLQLAATTNGHARLTRDIAAITLDLDTIETIDLTARGGADTLTIGDLTTTTLTTINSDLAAFGMPSDGTADEMIVLGTDGIGADMFEESRTAFFRLREDDGETRRYAKYIAHADAPGVICWREVLEEEVPADRDGVKRQFTKDDLLPHVPTDKPVTKEALRSKANQAGIALNKINGLIAELVDEGRLYEWRVKRKGTNPQRMIARFAQPEPELIEVAKP